MGATVAAGNGRVFISYRRQETAWPARQLYELLAGEFGADKIFKDVDNIAPGEDFVDRLTSAVSACEVLLALIGPQWLDLRDAEGNRRIDDPHDFVRLELAAALQRGVRVIPILVDGARMPAANTLPPELAPLTRRQAVEINPVGFNTERLVATLTEVLAGVTAPAAPAAPASRSDAAPTSITAPPDAAPTSRSESTRGLTAADLAGPPAVPIGTGQRPSDNAPDVVARQAPVVRPAPSSGGPSSQGTSSAGTSSAGTGSVPPRSQPPSAPASGGGRRRGLIPLAAGVGVLVLGAGVWLLPQLSGTSAPQGATPPAGSASVSAPPASPSPSTSASSGTGAVAGIPPIVAHRGGLEEHQFETQQAMEAAALAGFGVETDVRYTKDGVAVLVHDERATKGLDCGGTDVRVSQITWSKLRSTCHSKPTQHDPKKYEVPTLDATMEGIAAASSSSWVFVEVKTSQSAAQRKAFLGVFSKYGLSDRLVVTSFQRPWLKAIASTDSKARRMLFVSGKRIAASDLAADRLWGVAVEQGIATASYVADLHKAGLAVMIWVPNDASHWAAAVKLKPDMVMTAYPAGYQKWLKDR